MKARKVTFTLHVALVAAALAGLATPAFAQEAPPPAPAEQPPVQVHRNHALGGSGAGLGVGAAAFLGGPFGPEVVYDFGIWHLEALLGFTRADGPGPNPPSNTIVDFGVGGWYHLNIGDASDFSLGGSIGFSHQSFSPGGSNTAVAIDPGAMIRAFVTPNVAVHGRICVVLAFDDAGHINDHLALAGNIVSGFGMTYFFR